MALFWDLLVLPRAYVENLKAGRAHLPALPCAYMEKFKTRRVAAETPQGTEQSKHQWQSENDID